MRHTEDDMKKILEQELEISPKVERKLQETYKQIKNEGSKRTIMAKRTWRKFTAAAALAAITVTVTAGTAAASYLSEHSDFLQTMFGDNTRQSVGTEQVPADPDKNDGLMVTVPSTEYVPVDEGKADTLLGDTVLDEPVSRQIGEHTMTIQNLVTDGNVVLMYYTLERPGGVTALYADEETNRAKGAYITDESDFYYTMTDQNGSLIAGSTYIDLEKSTDEKYYLYDYMVITGENSGEVHPQINITHYPMARGEMYALMEEEPEAYSEESENGITEEVWELPEMTAISTTNLEQDGAVVCTYSPISISVNMLFFAEDEYAGYDPYTIKNVYLEYQDGSGYQITGEDVNNAGYSCGVGTDLKIAYNRIVDTNEISQIIINDQVFEIQ